MRAGSAANAASAQSGFLDAGRKAELAAITAGGMTRLKIEQRQYEIGQEQYTLEQDRKLLQKQISDIQEFKINPLLEKQKTIELEIRKIEDEIYELENAQTNSLRSNNIELDAAKIKLDGLNEKLKKALDEIAAQKKVWEDAKFGIDEAKNAVDFLKTSLEEALDFAASIAAAWDSIKSKTITLTTNNVVTSGSSEGNDSSNSNEDLALAEALQEAADAAAALVDAVGIDGNPYELRNAMMAAAAAKAAADEAWAAVAASGSGGGGGGDNSFVIASSGGMVPKYMARGGMSIGSDTVPAMLTPGEFVMNKKATKAFGPMLAAINRSQYPSMLANKLGSKPQSLTNLSNLSAPTYQTSSTNISAPSNISNSTSVNNNSSSVYNYSVGINVGGSNANPQDIARAVMTQIKNVDSQRIRTQR